jgi:hypothetical protein
MNIKYNAAGVRRLLQDEMFQYILESIKEEQGNVFFEPLTSEEEREEAHTIIRALSKIENRIAQILQDEAIFDKRQ